MSDQLPAPIHRQDEYMVAMCRRLDTQNGLLAQILDRLPAPVALTVAGSPGEIRLREPLAPATSDTPTAGPAGSDPTAAPVTAPARRATAKKTAAAVKEGTPDG